MAVKCVLQLFMCSHSPFIICLLYIILTFFHVFVGGISLPNSNEHILQQNVSQGLDVNAISGNVLRQKVSARAVVMAVAGNDVYFLAGVTDDGKCFLSKIEATGGVSWITTFGQTSSLNEVNGIVVDESESVYVCGSLENEASASAKGGAMVAKYSFAGKQEWIVTQGSPSSKDTFKSLALSKNKDFIIAGGSYGSKASFLTGGGYTHRPVISIMSSSAGAVVTTFKPNPYNGVTDEEILCLAPDSFNSETILAGGFSGNEGVYYMFTIQDGRKLELSRKIKFKDTAVVAISSPVNRQGTYYALTKCSLFRIDGSPTASMMRIADGKKCLGDARGVAHRNEDDTLVVLVEGESKNFLQLYRAANGELLSSAGSTPNSGKLLNGPVILDNSVVVFTGVRSDSKIALISGTVLRLGLNTANSDTQGFTTSNTPALGVAKKNNAGIFSSSANIVKFVAIGGSVAVLIVAVAVIMTIVRYNKGTGPPA